MIQFNLLPDVKQEYLKANYLKRMIMLIASVASVVCLVIFILLFIYVRVSQKSQLSSLDKSINDNLKTLQENNPDLDKILTIQNQINSLPALYDKRVIASRLKDYFVQVTPLNATISDFELKFEDNTLVIEGNTDTIATVDKFIDTLKFTRYQVNRTENNGEDRKQACIDLPDDDKLCRAFKTVVLDSYKIEDQTNVTETNGGPIAFKIKTEFNPEIFQFYKNIENGKKAVSLDVPKRTTTRSFIERPDIKLFAPKASEQQPDNTDNQNPDPFGQGGAQ